MCKYTLKDGPCAVNTDCELGPVELERETQPQGMETAR